MTRPTEGLDCEAKCWIGAGVGALLLFLLLWLSAGWAFLLALLAGAVIAAVAGYLVINQFCEGQSARPIAKEPAPERDRGAGSAPQTAPQKREAAPAEETGTPVKAKATPAHEQVTAAEHPAAVSPQAPHQPQAAASDRYLDAPRDGKADDLKQIKGVGPKLEEKLNALGIWHFDQIAALTPQEMQEVDDKLNLRGRIERDGWIGQARALTETSAD